MSLNVYWPCRSSWDIFLTAVFGNFFWPGARGSLLGLSPHSNCIYDLDNCWKPFMTLTFKAIYGLDLKTFMTLTFTSQWLTYLGLMQRSWKTPWRLRDLLRKERRSFGSSRSWRRWMSGTRWPRRSTADSLVG